MPVTLSGGKINGVRNGTGTGKYRNAVLTLCAPVAALKIVSSETSGSPIFLGCSPTRRHKFTFGSAACSGTPCGYCSLIAMRALSNLGRHRLYALGHS